MYLLNDAECDAPDIEYYVQLKTRVKDKFSRDIAK